MADMSGMSRNTLLNGVLVPILVVLIFLGGFFVISPKYKSLNEQKRILQENQQVNNRRRAALDDIQRLIADLDAKRSQLTAINGVLPLEPAVPEILANFDYLAQQSGILLGSFQIIDAETLQSARSGSSVQGLARTESILGKTEDIGIMEINIDLTGQYVNLKTFITNLERNLRLMDIQGLTVSSGGTLQASQEYNMKIHVYYQKDGNE